MSKRYRRRVILLLLAAGFLLIDRPQTSAHSYYLVNGQPVVWRNGQCTRFLSPSTFPPQSDPDLQIRSAMGEWNRVAGSNFTYGFVRLDQDYPIDHFDGLNDTAAVPAWQLDPGVLGVTYLVNYLSEWFDTDILFSDSAAGSGYSFNLFPGCEEITNPRTHGYSFLLVAMHELGHGLGLGHDPQGTEPAGSAWFTATMNPRYPSGGTFGDQNIIELHTDDRSGLRFLYPQSGAPGGHYVDLASGGYTAGTVVGKAVPVFVEPSLVYPGEELRVRSEIKNLGTAHAFFVKQGFYLSRDDQLSMDDESLGFLEWNLAFGDAISFDAVVPVPDDLAAGEYYLGTVLDDDDAVAEAFEDNNAVIYCDPVTIRRLAPRMHTMGQYRATCGRAWTGPTPSLTHPVNMNPIAWSLDNPEPGMTVNTATGVIRWPQPRPSNFLYTLILRATNSAGSDTEIVFLGVDRTEPAFSPMADVTAACGATYTGPPPQLTSPDCMNPILLWSLDSPPQGMTIHPATGVVSWVVALPAPVAHTLTLRAVNSAGAGSVTWRLSIRAADFNGNGRIDQLDASPFVQCLVGPAATAIDRCRCSDLDGDGDADLRDIAQFQRTFVP
jgi:hypothetical protein